jgi:hypothetical protein
MRNKGIWRLWLVASLAWAAYLAWSSDLACPLRLLGIDIGGGPWCEFQNADPYKYYGDLALRMVGIPLLAAAAIIAPTWVIAGFRSKNSK